MLAAATKLLCLSLAIAQATGAVTERPDPVLRDLLIEAVNEAESFEDRFDAEVWLTDMSTRLQKQVDGLEKEKLSAEKRLFNPGFVEKAPPEIVEGSRTRLQEVSNRLERLRRTLEAIAG